MIYEVKCHQFKVTWPGLWLKSLVSASRRERRRGVWSCVRTKVIQWKEGEFKLREPQGRASWMDGRRGTVRGRLIAILIKSKILVKIKM